LPPLSVNTIAFISTLGLITLPMFFGPAFGSFAAIVTAIFALLIGFIFGYWIASIGIIVIVIVLAVLNKMTEKRTES
jgi:membrane protein implicated in regulation of membrane protease activity